MKNRIISVKETQVTILTRPRQGHISLTDMLKATGGDFFNLDRLRNGNTVEFPSIRESIVNPNFNSGESATIKSLSGQVALAGLPNAGRKGMK